MAKWDYLFESDKTLRQAERDRAAGKITQKEFAVIWVRAGEAKRLREFIYNHRRWDLKAALGCPDRCPPDMEAEGELDGYRLKMLKATPGTRAHRLKIQCPVCGKWVGASAGKMGQHLKRSDHHGVNTQKDK